MLPPRLPKLFMKGMLMKSDYYETEAAPAEPTAASGSTFDYDRVEVRAGEDGHYWQVLVDGGWQSGRCSAGCDKATAVEHLG